MSNKEMKFHNIKAASGRVYFKNHHYYRILTNMQFCYSNAPNALFWLIAIPAFHRNYSKRVIIWFYRQGVLLMYHSAPRCIATQPHLFQVDV